MRFLIILLLWSSISFGQDYKVNLTPVTIEGLGGLQSYAVGTHDGEWLLVGGRLDGLHQRQPFASFSPDGMNQDLIVVNPKEEKVWRLPLSNLPANYSEQLSSTNMQFYQSNNKLLCIGGYGYSPSNGDHITYPYLTIIDIPNVIDDIKNESIDASNFSQIEDELFRVTGGALNQIDGVYQLIGGHKFMGRYNPMGPDHGPGFEQDYTNEIRRFTIDLMNENILEIIEDSHDEIHLHRRDYNLAPYIKNGERLLMAYSGVFKTTSDYPWLYPISISQNNYEAIESFSQYYNHYHCAHLPIFDSESGDMQTIFFGGIAQFYQKNGDLIQDNDIPFVNTIATVQYTNSGELIEKRLTETMPDYLGAGSVLILDSEIEQAFEGVIDGSKIEEEFKHIGYIYGGIRSSLPNIFWINTGNESEASSTIYQLSLRKRSNTTGVEENEKDQHVLFYPNPANKSIRMSIDIETPVDFSITIYDTNGSFIHKHAIKKEEVTQGRNLLLLENVNIGFGAFNYVIELNGKKIRRKVVWVE